MKARNCLVVLVNIIMLVTFSVYSASADVINSTVCSAGADYTTIQDAVDAAKDGSDTYKITLCNDETFVENVSIYSDVDLTLTTGNAIIDGGVTDSVISITNVSTQNVTLDGLTITKGAGAGIYVDGSSPSITNCTISSNSGSGVYITSSTDTTIFNCTIENNSSSSYGGGVRIESSSSRPVIENCLIRSNSASSYGGGISIRYSTSPSLSNCIIDKNNGLSDSGGVWVYNDSSPKIINCLVTRNNGGININQYSGNSSLVNCTVGDNTGYGVYYRNISGSGHSIINSIVWGSEKAINNQSGSGLEAVTYSDIQGGWEGEGNIENDPLFSAPEDDDFRLRCASPAKDAGRSDGAPPKDLDGYNRPVGSGYDIGAYEYQSTASCPTPSTITVGDSGDYSTIQAAINAAKDDDTILVDIGTYEENIDFKGKDIKVISEDEERPEYTIIDGGGSGNVVTFDTYEGTGAELNGFTIMDGSLGISLANFAMPSITNCIITSNSDNGIYVGYAFGNITDSQITDNTGVGIEASHSNLTVANSTIDNNSATGIFVHDLENAYISKCTIENNSSSSFGGGLHIYQSPHLTLDGCLIRGNTASSYGGGISIYYSSYPYLSNCIIDKNNGLSNSGGVWIYNDSSPKLINCLVTSNNGGININQYSGNSSLVNCTVGDNTGYGVYYRNISGSGHSIINSIVWGNTTGIDNQSGSGLEAVIYSDIQGGWTGTGNINVDPDFVDSTAGNYHLNASSSCINAGTAVDVFTDLDGNIRPIDCAYDMGAYEYTGITSDYGIISGYVIDSSNNPVSAANVNLREYQAQGIVLGTTTSNSDGYYEFNSLSNKIYIIEADDGSSSDRRTGKTNKSLPWAMEEFINLYLCE